MNCPVYICEPDIYSDYLLVRCFREIPPFTHFRPSQVIGVQILLCPDLLGRSFGFEAGVTQ